MPAHWETGVVVNTPTWHKLERAVLPEHITDWTTGLKEAGIDWEVYSDDVFVAPSDRNAVRLEQVPGWRAVRRDDSHAVLAMQPASYALVPIAKFGEVVETIAGKGLAYEAIFSLYNGKMIVALLYFDDPLEIHADAGVTRTVSYVCMQQRFDGQGGIRGIPTNVRTICANTVNAAEALDGKELGFSIAHTSNWEERVEQAASVIQTARRDAAAWTVLANRLSLKSVGRTARDGYLKRFLPISSDMTDRQVRSLESARDSVRGLLTSETNAHIATNAYGLVSASVEWADHIRTAKTTDSEVARQFRKEPHKARAIRVACQMAGIKRSEILKEAAEVTV